MPSYHISILVWRLESLLFFLLEEDFFVGLVFRVPVFFVLLPVDLPRELVVFRLFVELAFLLRALVDFLAALVLLPADLGREVDFFCAAVFFLVALF